VLCQIVLACGDLRAKNVSCGDLLILWSTRVRDGSFPQFTNRIACMGFHHRGNPLRGSANRRLKKYALISVLSGFLHLSFAVGMATGLGVKTPFDYSVFSAAGAAFFTGIWEYDRFTLDIFFE